MKTLHMAKPHVLVVIGGPGSGKTAFASKFADTFSAPYIDAKAFHLEGNDATTTIGLVYDILRQIHKTKQTIVYEGLSGTRAERTQVAKLAREYGYEPLFIWVQTDPAIAHGRATKRTRSNPNPMPEDVFEAEQKRFTPPAPHEKAVVISGMHTHASQAKAVLKRLAETRGRAETPTRSDEDSPRPPRRPVIIR